MRCSKITFSSFITKGLVRKGSPQIQKAKALIRMSGETLYTAESTLLNERTASSVLSIAYSALRQVLEAICLYEGYKVYSHEAYTHFLKDREEFLIAERFDRLRKLRNGVEYYAKGVSIEVTTAAIKEVAKLRKQIIEKHLKKI